MAELNLPLFIIMHCEITEIKLLVILWTGDRLISPHTNSAGGYKTRLAYQGGLL